MFDRVTNIQRPFYETGNLRDLNVTVHEHRAPTDESIKLVKEIGEKVREDIEKGIRLEFNGLKVFYYKAYGMMGLDHRFVFDLNGKRELVEIQVDEFQTKGDPQKFCQEIVKQFSERISILILQNMTNDDIESMIRDY